MKFIEFDEFDGTILGFEVDNEQFNYEDGWFTITDEAYDYVLSKNGWIVVNIENLQEDIANYKTVISNRTEDTEIPYLINDIEKHLKDRRSFNLETAINGRIRKNNALCKMFIENGISYRNEANEIKQFSYKQEDQINYNELKNLIDNGILTNETLVPLKANDESEYSFVTVEEFLKIYNELVKNKYYQLFYLKQINEYVKTLTTANDIHRFQYEMLMPNKYAQSIAEQMDIFKRMKEE